MRSRPTETKDEAEAHDDFWSVEGDFIYRHHIEPRVQLHVPEEEPFPIPLKHIDVIRITHTNLDVLQEKRIDDNWDVDGDKTLSDSWTGFTKFTFFNEKFLPGSSWSGERPTKIQATTWPDCLWPEIWTSKKRWKQEWTLEKSKIDNARKLRGIKISLIHKTKSFKRPSETQVRISKFLWKLPCRGRWRQGDAWRIYRTL